jgi:RNA-directed DNA polymerase
MAMVLGPHLSPHLSKRCFHLAGHGGAKAAVRQTAVQVTRQPFIFRTDVKQYYANIDHGVLEGLLRQHIKEEPVLRLLQGYMQRTVYDGVYETKTLGISLGCSLSPLMGALYLKPLDDRMHGLGLFYARFMDDLGCSRADAVEIAAGGVRGE